ncbi:serine hydrolase [Nocardioides sp. GY 10113]|uniref:serine hydrolase domain-containing protein n=1 Tax=Nocardioides sp. GY 10113 TaxID=2569761 RepID=UPI0014587AB5|nr:serine hydrolase [Nocardioides sp. GY 10113]
MTSLSRQLTIPVAVVLLLTSCGDEGDSPGAAETSGAATVDVGLPADEMSDTDATAVDDAVDAAGALSVSPGYWVGVYDPEKGYYEQAYGEAEAGGAPAAVDQVLRIGSISKTFTATVVLQLVDEGELELDQTVAEAGPEVAETFSEVAEVADVTLRELLTMRSGIQDYMNVPDATVAETAANPDTVYDADTLIRTGLDAGGASVGTYSTTNYLILQEIVEEVTGSSLQDLIRSRITEPLGMSVAALPPNEDTTLPEPGTHGYLNAGCVKELKGDGATGVSAGEDTTDWNVSYGQGGGGMHSTLRDLGIWALSGSGDALLPDELVTERLTTEDLSNGLPYGLGIFQIGDWIGHEGEALGWEALSFYNPDTGVALAFGTNACNGNFPVFLQVTDALYPDTGLADWIG